MTKRRTTRRTVRKAAERKGAEVVLTGSERGVEVPALSNCETRQKKPGGNRIISPSDDDSDVPPTASAENRPSEEREESINTVKRVHWKGVGRRNKDVSSEDEIQPNHIPSAPGDSNVNRQEQRNEIEQRMSSLRRNAFFSVNLEGKQKMGLRHSNNSKDLPLCTQGSMPGLRLPLSTDAPSAIANISQIDNLTRENFTLAKEWNDMKREVLRKEEIRKETELTMKALRSLLEVKDAEISRLKLENKSLRVSGVDENMERERIEKQCGRKRKKQKISLDVKYRGVASCVEKDIPNYCRREVMELNPFLSGFHRCWVLRSEFSRQWGYPTTEDQLFLPTPPLTVAGKREYFSPSYRNLKEFIKTMVLFEMGKKDWSSLFTEEEGHSCVKAIMSDVGICDIVRQRLSDEMSRLKRKSRDKLLSCLGYEKLLSRSSKPNSFDDVREKQDEVNQASDKLLSDNTVNIPIDLAWWRKTDVSLLCRSGYELSRDLQQSVIDDKLFGNVVSFHVLREFRGHPVEDSNGQSTQSSIITLARLDAWIATFLRCMRHAEGRGGGTQKEYRKEFSKLLPVATKQLLDEVANIIREKYPSELSIRIGNDDRDPVGNRAREATRVVHVDSQKVYYILVKRLWFEENVSKALGGVMDCYIGKGSLDGTYLEVSGSEVQLYPDAQPT